MLRKHISGPARFVTRQFGRGVFFGLLGLALAVATVSFLTACRCSYPFVGPAAQPAPKDVPAKDEPPPADQPLPPIKTPSPPSDTKVP